MTEPLPDDITPQPAGQAGPVRCKRPGCHTQVPSGGRGRTRVFCGPDCARRYHNAQRSPAAAAGPATGTPAELEQALETALTLARQARAQAAATDPEQVRAQIADAEAARRRAEAAAATAAARAAQSEQETAAAWEAVDAARHAEQTARQTAQQATGQLEAARAQTAQHTTQAAQARQQAAAAIAAATQAADGARAAAGTQIAEARAEVQRAGAEVTRARQAEHDARAETSRTRADAARERDTLTAGHAAQLNAAEQACTAMRIRAERAEQQLDTATQRLHQLTTPAAPARNGQRPPPARRSRTSAPDPAG